MKAVRLVALMLALLYVAGCSSESGGPPSVAMPTPEATPIPTPTPAPSYLTEEVAACTPAPGSEVDPCDPDAEPFRGIARAVPYLEGTPDTLQQILDGPGTHSAWAAHLVVRGTYLPDTMRCSAGTPYKAAPHVSDVLAGPTTPTKRSIRCFADVRANAYLVGTGPATLTVSPFSLPYRDGDYANEDGTDGANVESLRHQIEAGVDNVLSGREFLLFLGPPPDLAHQVWNVVHFWYIHHDSDDTVLAVHPLESLWVDQQPDVASRFRSRLRLTLPTFAIAIDQADTLRTRVNDGRIGSDEDLPELVTDANKLGDYYAEVEATDPAMPPPPCGKVVPDQANNPGLMADCMAMLGFKDALRGAGAFNWSVDTAMAEWDGVRMEEGRVVALNLDGRGLTGTLPPALADLTGLKFLFLNDNSLTGSIPSELGTMPALVRLMVADNDLSGSIPSSIGNIATLEQIWLHDNSLTGSIPSELGSLSNLTGLSLGSNNLTGPIPWQFIGLDSIEGMNLGNNGLTGPIPEEFVNLTTLKALSLVNNELSGQIPRGLTRLTQLGSLQLVGNEFTGCVPVGLKSIDANDLDQLGLPDCAG